MELITIHEYNTNPTVKERANALMERFRVDLNSCDQIHISDDGHLVSFHVRMGDTWHWVRRFNSDV
jgi:hypothetical protein